jgi:hypothetical protein
MRYISVLKYKWGDLNTLAIDRLSPVYALLAQAMPNANPALV